MNQKTRLDLEGLGLNAEFLLKDKNVPAEQIIKVLKSYLDFAIQQGIEMSFLSEKSVHRADELNRSNAEMMESLKRQYQYLDRAFARNDRLLERVEHDKKRREEEENKLFNGPFPLN